MKFLLDVCVSSRSLTAFLVAHGHDVVSALGIDPSASDERLLALALQEDRVFLTEDVQKEWLLHRGELLRQAFQRMAEALVHHLQRALELLFFRLATDRREHETPAVGDDFKFRFGRRPQELQDRFLDHQGVTVAVLGQSFYHGSFPWLSLYITIVAPSREQETLIAWDLRDFHQAVLEIWQLSRILRAPNRRGLIRPSDILKLGEDA